MKFCRFSLLIFSCFGLLVWPAQAATKSSHPKAAAADDDDSDTPPPKKGTATKPKPKAEEGEESHAPAKESASAKTRKAAGETDEDAAQAHAKKSGAATPKGASTGSKDDDPGADAAAPKSKGSRKGDAPEAAVEATAKETAPATPPAKPGGTGAPPAFIESTDLKDFASQPEKVQKLIEAALVLSHQGLTYKFGSDDPANGGMDCSGSIAYMLRQQGFKDVPRDASGQYAWARKNGKFFAVVSKKAGGFEFEDLKPGDLMFWSGTYAVDKDPPVTHTMIYLGEHRARKQRVMWGSSDGRTYDGKSRFGVGVFDFKMPKPGGEGEGANAAGKSPDFLGYARIPGLREEKTPETEKPEKSEEPKAVDEPKKATKADQDESTPPAKPHAARRKSKG